MSRSLYSLTFPNGKKYIGISTKPRRRFGEHALSASSGSDLPVHRAIRKYGTANVVLDVLCIGDARYISELEIQAILTFGTRNQRLGYNVTHGGEISPMWTPSVVEKAKLAATKRADDPDYRMRISEALSGRICSAQHRARNSAAKVKNWRDPEYRARQIAAHTGKKQSEQTRQKRALALSGHPQWNVGQPTDSVTGRFVRKGGP